MRKALLSTLPILLIVAGCNNSSSSAPAGGGTTTTGGSGQATPVASGGFQKLEIKETKPGKGKAAALGDTVWVSYVGKLTNGTVFDSTERSGGRPFTVTLGAGEVIKGWEEGLVGSKTGSKRTLNIPYKLAYGEPGRPPTIPARADLVFDIDVLGVVKQGDEGTVDVTPIKEGAGAPVKEGSKVTVNYVGTLVNGQEFDSTKAQGKPFTFTVGKGETLPGIDAGVVGMKKGGKRRLFIPPALGLRFGTDTIPPNNPLIVEIEVVDVK